MKYTDNILFQTYRMPFGDEIIFKFLKILGDILAQYGRCTDIERAMDLVDGCGKDLLKQNRWELREGVYMNKLRHKFNPEDYTNVDMDDYIPMMIDRLSIAEQLYVLSYLKPEHIKPRVEVEAALSYAIYDLLIPAPEELLVVH